METVGDAEECRMVSLKVKGVSGSLVFGPQSFPISTKVSEVSEQVLAAQGIDSGCNLQLCLGTEELAAEESLAKWALEDTLTLTSIITKHPPPVGNYKMSESVNMRDFSYDYAVHVTIEADIDGNGLVTWAENIGGWGFGFDMYYANLKGTVTVAAGGALTFHLKGQCKHCKYGGEAEIADHVITCKGSVRGDGLYVEKAPVAAPSADRLHVLHPTEDSVVFKSFD